MRHRATTAVVATLLGAIACADVGTAPDAPVSIEWAPFPSPAVVVGDTLRNEAGAVAPVRAIVRNARGDALTTTSTRYLYADFNRDSALRVDSLTGIVIATKAVSGQPPRLAARIGGALQVIQTLLVTVRPDTVDGRSLTTPLTTVFPDTGRAKAAANTVAGLGVTVRNRQGASPVGVNGWLVRFTLLRPANPANDTALAAYLVSDAGTASTLDTTDTGGSAERRVRVRADRFPAVGTDTVVVQATVLYRGKPVAGSGVRLTAPVKRGP